MSNLVQTTRKWRCRATV